MTIRMKAGVRTDGGRLGSTCFAASFFSRLRVSLTLRNNHA
ncbi:hypothetical protein FHX09_000640 [Rhizobium sp. BK538]|nr:hypothetical protein [Rhizobium sp. BK538]